MNKSTVGRCFLRGISVGGWLLAVGVVMATGAWAEESAGTVRYWDCKDSQEHSSPGTCRELDSSVNKLENNGWYVVSETRTIDHTIEVEMNGHVAHIILCDGVTLTVNGTPERPGIDVTHHGTLHIYGQKGQTGTLIARGGVNGAGIGTHKNEAEKLNVPAVPVPYTGCLEFHGGRITACGGDYGAGIGGSRDSFGNNVIVYGGEVTATGGYFAAGIGAGAYAGHGLGDKIWRDDLTYGATRVRIMRGAKVHAKGGYFAAGIGGSYRNTGGCCGLRTYDGIIPPSPLSPEPIYKNALIIEGSVWAEGGEGAAGIGGAKGGDDGTCHIIGDAAEVSAIGGGSAFGIGSGEGAKRKDEFVYVVYATWCDTWEGDAQPGVFAGGGGGEFMEFNRTKFVRIKTSNLRAKPISYWDTAKGRSYTVSNYRLLGAGTESLYSDTWYVVTNLVRNTRGLWCNDHAKEVRIVLMNGSQLEIEAPDNKPGIMVTENNDLTIYAESKDGNGTLIACGGENGAGIGGNVDPRGYWLDCGPLTIHGGRITCVGGAYAAGIGGSSNGSVKSAEGGGMRHDLTIYGGEVMAIGGWASAGVGGAAFGYFGRGQIFVDGGSLCAYGGLSKSRWLPGIGAGVGRSSSPADIYSADSAKRDFVIWEGDDESAGCRIVKNDSYCSVGTNSYVGILVGRTARVEYLDGNGVVREVRAEVLIPGESPANPGDTTSDRWFVVEGNASFTQTLTLPGATANLILQDGLTLSVAGSGATPALKARALNVFGQEFGTGTLKAQGESNASGILTEGACALYGGRIVASGMGNGLSGGSLTVVGGRLAVSCQQTGLAYGTSGAVTIRGGQVAVTNGTTHVQASSLMVTGGNLLVESGKLADGAAPPKNSAGATLHRLTVVLPDWFGKIDDETAIRIADWEGPASYGLDGLFPIAGRVYLWLPNGTYSFNVDCYGLKIPYQVTIDNADAEVNPGDEVFDLAVNGIPVQTRKTGEGWNYQDETLHLTGEGGTFVISGSSTRGSVQILVEKSMTVVLSNATVVTSGRSAMQLMDGVLADVRTVDGVSMLSASGAEDSDTGAGIEVAPLSGITISGEGSSILHVSGGWGSAGIGGTSRNGLETRHCGKIDITSGNVIALGGDNGAGIGGGREGMLFGDIVLECGAIVTATGGWGAAGIGGGLGSWTKTTSDDVFARGEIRLAGAIVSAGGGVGAAGIGGGRYINWTTRRKRRKIFHWRQGQTPQVNVERGTIVVTSGESGYKTNDLADDEFMLNVDETGLAKRPPQTPCADIGLGDTGWYPTAIVRILGGTIIAAHDTIDPVPTCRSSLYPVRRVSVVDAGLIDGQPVSLVMNDILEYGVKDIYPVDGKIHLYLPDLSERGPNPTTHYFLVDGIPYVAKLSGTNTVATRCTEAWDCKVTIKSGAPRVSGFVVSNNFEQIMGREIGDGTEYIVKAYDDVTINFAVDEGYVRAGGNQIFIPGIVDDVTIPTTDLQVHPFNPIADGTRALVSHGTEWIDLDYRDTASTRAECVSRPAIEIGSATNWSRFLAGVATELKSLKIYEGDTLVRDLVPFMTTDDSAFFGLYDKVTKRSFTNGGRGAFGLGDWPPSVPYRAWNEATRQMEDRVCDAYSVVTADTAIFEDGQWYVVTNAVQRGMITVKGAAHLILCDGARLTLTGSLAVPENSAISIHGQNLGTGELNTQGDRWGSGIGGHSWNRSGSGACGAVTIDGGRVQATGGKHGAGIGGHKGAGGTVTINGGVVSATGGANGTGIGSGYKGGGGTVTINGGTVTAAGGSGAGIGRGRKSWGDFKLTIDGGSVKANVAKGLAKNSTPTNVYCVTVKCEGIRDQGSGIRLEGLEGYGTNDIYAVEGKVYLWLPNGTHHFTLSDGTTTHRYCAVVKGVAITVEPLVPVGFFVNGVDIGKEGAGTGWVYMSKNLTLNGAGPYVLSGEATNDEVHIHVISPNAATVILSNAVVFASENPPALNVDQNTSLLMAGGTSYIAATNDIAAVSVGADAALTVGLAPGADEAESMICVFNYGNRAAVDGAGSVAVNGGTLAVWADRQASAAPLTRAADVFCMLAGDTPETAKVVDQYNGEAYVLVTAAIAPVTLDKPVGPFDTPEAASNAMAKAVFMPSAAVESKLGAGSPALGTYCDMFGFAVTGGGGSWSVKAALYPEAWTNVAESAQAATRQIDVAGIAALATDGKKDVSVTSCVPGFYYTLYGAQGLSALPTTETKYGPELSGVSGEVTFPQVKKPSDAAGFFTIGAREVPDDTP